MVCSARAACVACPPFFACFTSGDASSDDLPTFSPPQPPKPWSKRHVNRVKTPQLFDPDLGGGNDELVKNGKEKIQNKDGIKHDDQCLIFAVSTAPKDYVSEEWAFALGI